MKTQSIQEDEKFMRCALTNAKAAFDAGEFPVGCVIVENGRVIAEGVRKDTHKPTSEMEHSELVALRNLLESGRDFSMNNITVYSTMEPCLMCYSTLILNGVRRIVYGYEDVMGGGSSLKLQDLPPLYSNMEVEVIPGVLRNESLRLFQQFFANPKNDYWKGSPLSQYTLAQNVTHEITNED